jgi:hypothetical protein
MGYLLGFSVREGNIAFLTSILPEAVEPFSEMKEYGEMMARCLGFGRMARQALHPLIQTLITDPLQWYVNQQYAPKLLGEGLAVRAYNRGKIDGPTFATEMAYAGYNTTRSAVLQEDSLTHLSAADAWTLYKNQKYSSEQLQGVYQNNGMDPSTSGDWIESQILNECAPWITALIQDWKSQTLAGYVTLAQFEGFVDTLNWPTDVANALKNAVGQICELPRKKLTLAEVQSALVEGLVDSTYLQTFLKNEGYSSDDQLTLYYQTLIKLGTQEAKVAVAQYTYDKAVKTAQGKNLPIPPPPAILAGSPVTPTGGLSL